ncbi:MAG TPA: imidazole glycerol phosphate synthase subunit HisH [Vicinamibacterales bacterium]|nr:imidazole glycerol phosphate synthase subunit HisH [Vicinamibacterales bacterium]
MTRIAVVDYGAGNVQSVMKALAAVDAAPLRAIGPTALSGADAIIIPGVGHFAATRALDDRWRAAIATAIDDGTPLLGICLGLQWLFDGSDEATNDHGLGFFAGRSQRIAGNVKVPHVGWNQLDRTGCASRLLDGVPDGAAMYFSHTFAAPPSPITTATTSHGSVFASAVERANVFGVQGHPEKSGAVGLRLLATFVAIARASRRC